MERIRRQVGAFHRDESGVTLVELLVVIAILAILAAVVVPNFTGLIGSGKAQANAAELTTLQTIVDAYMADNRVTALTAGTVTPANYSTGIFSAPKNYFRSAPYCSYGYDATGQVTQTSCPP